MSKGMLGKKIGMTQVYDEAGNLTPVTVIEAGSCVIVQVKSEESDGYSAVQVGFDEVDKKKLTRPEQGHFEKAGVTPRRYLAEFRCDNGDWQEAKVGDELAPTLFSPGDRVKVRGVSRGKGFAGVIKRHGYHRGPMSHGSRYHRGPGSLGGSAFPARVMPGTKLPGRMGGQQVTVENLEVIRVDTDNKLLLVKGSIPGPRGGIIRIEHQS